MRTPRTIHDSGSAGAGVSAGGPDLGPMQDPEAERGVAPGGRWPGADLPSISVQGGSPMVLNGYTPQRNQDALPPPGSTDGNQTGGAPYDEMLKPPGDWLR